MLSELHHVLQVSMGWFDMHLDEFRDRSNCCGGVFGYLNLLESLADPNCPNHDEARDWVDEDFDSTRFDAATVNSLLTTLR